VKKISHILFFLLIANWLIAQNYGLSIGNATGCEGDAIEIAVTAHDLNMIGAITLFIDYPVESLEFDTLTSLHPLLAALIYNDIQGGSPPVSIGKIGFAWSGFNPANLRNDVLFKLHFIFTGPATEIGFAANCEIVDTSATILSVNYVDGQVVYSDTIELFNQPQPAAIIGNGNAFFSINAANVNYFSWQMWDNGNWQYLTDDVIVSGSSSPTLTLYNPSLDWNGRYFRCFLKGCNSAWSDSALLEVYLDIGPMDESTFDWKVCRSSIASYIRVNSVGQGNLSLSLVAFDGRVVERLFSGNIHNGTQSFEISTKPDRSGIYLLRLDFMMPEKIIHQTKKLYLQTL
jgi:hypothetical protein